MEINNAEMVYINFLRLQEVVYIIIYFPFFIILKQTNLQLPLLSSLFVHSLLSFRVLFPPFLRFNSIHTFNARAWSHASRARLGTREKERETPWEVIVPLMILLRNPSAKLKVLTSTFDAPMVPNFRFRFPSIPPLDPSRISLRVKVISLPNNNASFTRDVY